MKAAHKNAVFAIHSKGVLKMTFHEIFLLTPAEMRQRSATIALQLKHS